MDCVELIIWKNDKETHSSNLEHVLLETAICVTAVKLLISNT